MDVLYAFPSILLAIAICGMLGAGLGNTILALTVTFIPPIVRISESVTTQVRGLDFVEAARASGGSALSVLRLHVLNNVLGPILVYATSLISVCIILAAGLSLPRPRRHAAQPRVGPHAQQPAAALWVNPVVAALPGVMIFVTSMCFNLMSDGLRQAMDVGCEPAERRRHPSPRSHQALPAQGRPPRREPRRRPGRRPRLVRRARGARRSASSASRAAASRRRRGSWCGCIEPDAGEVTFDGATVGAGGIGLRELRRQVQMVFQDSYSSLNPRLSAAASIAYGPFVHGMARAAARERAHELLQAVGLDPGLFANRYPHELSGGQRQRINIARALALEPRLVLLDEAVSALDKSIGAQVLNLLADLKERFHLTYVFISHDLNVVRHISDRVMVMYLGKVVEIGDVETLYREPQHPYTRALLSAMPSMDPVAAHARGAAVGRSAQSHQPAVRLPLPHALPHRRATSARARSPRSPRSTTPVTPSPATRCSCPRESAPCRLSALERARRPPAATDAPVVSVRDLRVTFASRDRTVHAVNGVSFDLAAGEVLGILGESGSGKSVTLRALIGLLPPAQTRIEGDVRIAGTRPDAARRQAAGRLPRPHDRDDLPGADDGARPRLHDRRADRGDDRPPRGRVPQGRPGPRARAARPGADPLAGAPPRRLPARDVGRHAPAGHDRARAVLPAVASCSPTSRPPRSTSPCRSRSSCCCAGCSASSAWR